MVFEINGNEKNDASKDILFGYKIIFNMLYDLEIDLMIKVGQDGFLFSHRITFL